MEMAIGAARWVVSTALGPVTDGVLESWAASSELGPNVRALKVELLYAQGMLDSARCGHGRDDEVARSPALAQLLLELGHLAYGADDVLDELDYFRIQDELEGTYETTDPDDRGLVGGFVLNARHTARAVARNLRLFSSPPADVICKDEEEQEDSRQGCFSIGRSSCSCAGKKTATHSSSQDSQVSGHAKAEGGCLSLANKFTSSARNTARAVGKRLPCSSSVNNNSAATSKAQHGDQVKAQGGCLSLATNFTSTACNMTHSVGKCLRCSSVKNDSAATNLPPSSRPQFLKAEQRERSAPVPKLTFDRVELSTKMADIVEQLKPVCAKVATILDMELLGSAIHKLDVLISDGTRTTKSNNLHIPRTTTPEIIEHKLYGRGKIKDEVVDAIARGKHCNNEITVISIVGPGGIGKTTFTQHVYNEVKEHFIAIWICVSQNFNASKLAQGIVKQIPKCDSENKSDNDEELIQKRLQSKRFLLVLDDMWTYHEDEWKKLLAPFKKGGTQDNIVIVTTRIPKVAKMIASKECLIRLERLEDEECMHLFQACVFDNLQSWGDHVNLHSVGWDIVKKLKGSPLAVKTVGRLLRNKLTLDHWRKVLESKEWENQINDDDIMPALKLSYNYLCFDLQQCFSYCSLFPEDYEFDSNELINFWIGLGLLSNSNQNKRVEDIGSDYLYDLVDQGFLEKGNKEDGQTCYVIHDLLHELAVNVSSYECCIIDGSNVRSIQIPPSVRHLSVIIDTTDVKDRRTFENFKTNLSTVGKRMKAENLRTLMLFGDHHGSFAKTLSHLFGKAKSLRVLFLSGVTYNIEDIFPNFSKLVHLRYLRIKGHIYSATSLPSYISRFYHLLVLDLQQCNSTFISVREMRNLVKLRHCLVKDDGLHSEILEVGKLVCLQELRAFKVKKEPSGFELKQLGQLLQLRGSLRIYNLESVQDVNEADEANLVHMNHLDMLILEWSWATNRSIDKPKEEDDILESLKPHSNIREVSIRGHGGTTCPTWLGGELYIKNLECLHLGFVSWKSLPPLGELWMINDQGEECPSYITGQKFQNLKRIELYDIKRFKRWRRNGTHFFNVLEVLIVSGCPELIELPFSYSTSCPAGQEEIMTMFPKLWKIKITTCPKVLSLPPIPWSRTLCEAEIWPVGACGGRLSYMKGQKTKCMEVNLGNDDPCHTQLWDMVAFNNLSEIEKFDITNSPPIPLDQMQFLASLKSLVITNCTNVSWPIEGENKAQYKFPVEYLKLCNSGATGKELTQFVSYFPNISKLDLVNCETITWLGVVTETPEESSSASDDKTEDTQQQKQGRGEEDIEHLMEGLLLLPTQIQELYMDECPNLRLCSASLEEGTEGRPGLQGLSTLRKLEIHGCPKLLSSNKSPSSHCPFPTSLKNLSLSKVDGKFKLTPLSNLSRLHINDCRDLRNEDLWPLPVQGYLTELGIFGCPNLFLASEPLCPYEQDFLHSSKLQKLRTDGQGGILAVPVCSHLSSSLNKLEFYSNSDIVRFTKEQEEALQKLTSLQELEISSFQKLQSLPTVLNELTNIKRLEVRWCKAMQLEPKDRLPRSLTELKINCCPVIRSLPKGILPSSLQTLDVRFCCEELRRQGSKLRGTIPIIKT